MVRNSSRLVLLVACAVLLATPVLAADGPAPAAKKAQVMKTVAKKKHAWSCYDYAWQSDEMKNCLAKEHKS